MYNLLRMLNLDSIIPEAIIRNKKLTSRINASLHLCLKFIYHYAQPEQIVYSMFTESINARLSLTFPYIPTHCCFACHGFLHATFA